MRRGMGFPSRGQQVAPASLIEDLFFSHIDIRNLFRAPPRPTCS